MIWDLGNTIGVALAILIFIMVASIPFLIYKFAKMDRES
jgi:hypothetical protein